MESFLVLLFSTPNENEKLRWFVGLMGDMQMYLYILIRLSKLENFIGGNHSRYAFFPHVQTREWVLTLTLEAFDNSSNKRLRRSITIMGRSFCCEMASQTLKEVNKLPIR